MLWRWIQFFDQIITDILKGNDFDWSFFFTTELTVLYSGSRENGAPVLSIRSATFVSR
jgi:hypothetical protein